MPKSDDPMVANLIELRRGQEFATIMADPPWRFHNRTGKIAPEHQRLFRYASMSIDDIFVLPVGELAAPTAHLYLWVPNALLPYGLEAMRR